MTTQKDIVQGTFFIPDSVNYENLQNISLQPQPHPEELPLSLDLPSYILEDIKVYPANENTPKYHNTIFHSLIFLLLKIDPEGKIEPYPSEYKTKNYVKFKKSCPLGSFNVTITSKNLLKHAINFFAKRLLNNLEKFYQPLDVIVDNPLYFAVSEKNLPACRFFFPSTTEYDIEQSFAHALRKEYFDLCDFFLLNGVSLNAKYTGYMWHAAQNETPKACEYLMKNGLDVNHRSDEDHEPTIFSAVRHGGYETCKYLIENGASIDEPWGCSYPLHCACKKGRLDVCELLVKKGHEVNAVGRCGSYGWQGPLASSLYENFPEITKFLIEAGADVNLLSMGRSILYAAIKYCTAEGVDILLANGADPNFCKKNGKTILDKACKRGDYEIFRHLIRYGANIKNGSSTLFKACYGGNRDIVVSIINLGIRIDNEKPFADNKHSELANLVSHELDVRKKLLADFLIRESSRKTSRTYFSTLPLDIAYLIAKRIGVEKPEQTNVVVKRRKLEDY